MDVKTYYLKEILFGLRNEYIKIYSILKKLENYILMSNKNIKSVDLDIWNNCKKNIYQIHYSIVYKLSYLRHLTLIDDDKKIVKNSTGFIKKVDYYFRPDNKDINIENINIFHYFSNKIINSSILGELSLNKFFRLSGMDARLYMNAYQLGFFNKDNSNDYCISYDPKYDIIKIFNFNNYIYDGKINDILNTEIPANIFNSYLRHIIDKNINNENEVILDKNIDKHKTIKITKENNKILLK